MGLNDVARQQIMREITLESWDEFNRIIRKDRYHRWIFRGQSNYIWPLESSLLRAFRDAETVGAMAVEYPTNERRRLSIETAIIDKFKANAHLYLSSLPEKNDQISWISLMQHHGTPTRMLDFSFSPFVAAYFAIETGTDDAAIYCIDRKIFKRTNNYLLSQNCQDLHDKIFSSGNENEPSLYIFEPKFSNQRLLAQQGIFLVPSNLTFSHEEILDHYKLNSTEAFKYRIPSSLRKEGIKWRKQMNINAATMFPGLEGFCKSLKHLTFFHPSVWTI